MQTTAIAPLRPWHATYAELGITADIDISAHRSIAHMLEEAMKTHGHRPAFRALGQTLTHSDLDRKSAAFAAWLQTRLGAKKGDRIAVMMPNLLAFPIAFLGIVRAGAIQVNVNPMYTPRELEHQLNDAGCETIVIFNDSTPALAEVLEGTSIKTVISVGTGDGGAAALPSPAVDPRLAGCCLSFAEVLEQGLSMQRRPVELCAEDGLFLQYTGGTTGLSKGAFLSHGNLVANITQFKIFIKDACRPGQEVIVTAIPLYHAFALMVNFLTYLSLGAENWLVADPRDIDGLLDVLGEARPSVFMGVNTLFAGLAAHPRLPSLDFSRLRLAGGGGAAVVGATSQKWQAATGTFIREGYGLSETGPILCFNPKGITEFNGTTGLPVPGTDIKLLDAQGAEVPLGRPGEVCANGPQIMRGYWDKPDANAAAFTADGYFRTGDIGVFDERGFLKIVDRKKDMVIVSGFNVFPNEIEAVAASCPGVLESACIGVPDGRTGEAVRLFVVKSPGATLTADAVLTHCRERLTAYKVPRHVSLVEALPKSTVGKILRRELRTFN
jgi:long-chain acyl-CoA synthetase